MTPPPPDDWPFAEVSRIVASRPHRWHVQQIGSGPDMLLLHGAGASTHSWAALAPLLADRFRVTMIDLPGHGFTKLGTRSRSGLDPMAEDIASLLSEIGATPRVIVGHSAGAALALRLALDAAQPVHVICINGAFQMFDGIAAKLFPFMAKALSLNPLTVPVFTAASSLSRTQRLLEGTGSRISDDGMAQYHALVSDRQHVAGALAMMANWSLDRLVREAATLTSPVLLLAGGQDGLVPVRVSQDMKNRLQNSILTVHDTLGHLMHEEAPATVAQEIDAFLTGAATDQRPHASGADD